MRRHAEHTEAILARIGAFSELARVAAAHHERLDGGGYPRGLGAEAISLETRIITTADIFDAISADRPYRAAVPCRRRSRRWPGWSARRSTRSASTPCAT
jgi:HD-GYP domain-containing protein (c-di-GMP phosphodiesterase class II)